MDVFPAIDLRGGKVVRLRQGNPNAQTVFSDDPAQIARRWIEQGARWLHVVNLDGAFAGDKGRGTGESNILALCEILKVVNVPVQFGGGLRALQSIERALGLGVARVVLGTVAVQRPEIVREAIAKFGADKIVVGLDAKGGRIATHGWRVQAASHVGEVATQMRAMGVQRIVFTDIARDGMLQGVNAEATQRLARESGLKIIASGGVASLDDILRLKAVESDGVEGIIIGQALYTDAIDLPRAIEIAATPTQSRPASASNLKSKI